MSGPAGARSPEASRRRARVAAVISLIAFLAVVVMLIAFLIDHFGSFLIGLAGFALAIGGGWWVITEEMPKRAFGAVGVLAGVGLQIWAFVRAINGTDRILLRIGIILVLLAVAIAAARVAMFEAIHRVRVVVTTGYVPSHPVLLCNPWSGGGKVERFGLVNEAKRRGIEPVLLRPGDDLQALARQAAQSAEVIGMAGGDGSQALVAQVAMEHELAYVCVPAGTRNHLALDLGLDRDNVVIALDAFASHNERTIDLAFVNGRIFVNNVSLGIYAEIVKSEAYRDAKLETMQVMLPDLLGPRATPFDLRFPGPDGEARRSAQLLLVSNNPYRLDRLGGIGSRPRLDTGLLGIVAVEVTSAAQAAQLVTLQATGQVRRFHGWTEWTTAQFEIDSAHQVAAGIDGESITLEPPLQFTIAPAALRIRLPPGTPGLSPAALAPGVTRSTFRTLWEIATGR